MYYILVNALMRHVLGGEWHFIHIIIIIIIEGLSLFIHMIIIIALLYCDDDDYINTIFYICVWYLYRYPP